MRIPHMAWDRRHDVAALTVSFANRIWHRREVADLILGYNATGRLARIVVLDASRWFPPDAGPPEALSAVRSIMAGRVRAEDLAVVESAIERATASPGRSG